MFEALASSVSDRWNRRDDHSFDSYYNVLVGHHLQVRYGIPTTEMSRLQAGGVQKNGTLQRRSYVKSLNDKINRAAGAIDSHKCPEPVPCPRWKRGVAHHKATFSFGWQRRTSPRTSRSTSGYCTAKRRSRAKGNHHRLR